MSHLPIRPFPIVLAAPSGTGKTTIARALVAEGRGTFEFSVSATTRSPRPGEIESNAYAFLTDAEFRNWIEEDALLEWAEVHGNLYGTPRSNLDEAAARGIHLVLDIDVQGARQLRDRVPDAVLIFVFPPSAEVLEGRLSGRGTEPRETVRRRLRGAGEELSESQGFDYIVVNDDLPRAVEEVRTIVAAERFRIPRVRDLRSEVRRIREGIDRFLGPDDGVAGGGAGDSRHRPPER